jgi:hypothetical protein
MNQLRVLSATVIIFASLLPWIGGCGDDNSTSPGNSDLPGCSDFDFGDYGWLLEVFDPFEANQRYVMVTANDFDPQYLPEVSLKIEGTTIPLEHPAYGNWWTGTASLVAGQTYSFELTVDGRKSGTSVKIAYTPHAVFPDEIVSGKPARVTWSLDGPAACQIAAAGSGDMQDDEDVYISALKSSTREYTYPANCVPGWGDGHTYLSLAIFNRNLASSGDLLLISNGFAEQEYQSGAALPRRSRRHEEE